MTTLSPISAAALEAARASYVLFQRGAPTRTAWIYILDRWHVHDDPRRAGLPHHQADPVPEEFQREYARYCDELERAK